MITLYYSGIDRVNDTRLTAYIRGLPAFMQPEVTRYIQASDRKARLLARMMLLHAMRQSGHVFSENQWFTNTHHKPFIRGWLDFSISHSGQLVLLACGTGLVGADTEEKRTIDIQDMMHIFHPAEKAYIRGHASEQDAFYRLWSKKEALLKAAGVGLVNNLHDINCTTATLQYMDTAWHFYEPEIQTGYTCCVCSSLKDVKISLREFDPEAVTGYTTV